MAQTMTAEDAFYIRSWMKVTSPPELPEWYGRILATYHALAEKAAECERLREQVRLANIDVATTEAEANDLRATLASLQERYDEIHREWGSACERERSTFWELKETRTAITETRESLDVAKNIGNDALTALAEKTAECERLRQENMALGTENRMLWGDVERLRRENALLRAGAPLPPPAPTTLTADTDYAARRDSGEAHNA